MVFGVFAAPVGFHAFLSEVLNASHLVILIERWASPNKDSVLVHLVAWKVDLGSNAEDQECILLKIIKIKDGRALVPIRILVKSGLHLLLFVDDLLIVLHLSHHGCSLLKVDAGQINQETAPFSDIAVQLRWLFLALEEELPEVGGL